MASEAEVRATFDDFDADKNGHITSKELGDVFMALGESVPGYKIREMIAEVDSDRNGTIEFAEFMHMYTQVTSKGVFGQWTSLVSRREGIRAEGGTSEASAEGTTHTSSKVEGEAFADWINKQLNDDSDCAQYLPVTREDMFEKLKDGVIYCKLINLSVPKTIDERAINKGSLNAQLIQENLTLVINSAKAIGCTVVNIDVDSLPNSEHLALGLLWQIIRMGLFANITLSANPNLAALLREGETMEDLLKLSPEEVLLRWINYHLEKSGFYCRIQNFSGDIKNSEAYVILLSQVAPAEYNVDGPQQIMNIGNHDIRAEQVLVNADKLNARSFVTAKDILEGNYKLNLAFVANLFNKFPSLDPSEISGDVEMEQYEETREERIYRNWMNSLGVNPFVNHLYNELQSGLVLFQLYDDIQKGTVDWKRVNKAPFKLASGGNMKKIENCNYAVEIGKNKNFSLVGIGGEDIYNGTKTLVLALVWQMLRCHSMTLLASVLPESDATQIQDSQVVEWVNQKLADAGKSSRINDFKDLSIDTSVAVIDLVDAIKPGCIDYSLVTAGGTDEEKSSNAQYAISMMRKIGASTYAQAEDLVEVNPKMVLTVFVALMTRCLSA